MITIPIHGFICYECNHEFEAIRKMSDDSIPSCPKCDSNKYVEKTVGKMSFKLKGSGWFNDGYTEE